MVRGASSNETLQPLCGEGGVRHKQYKWRLSRERSFTSGWGGGGIVLADRMKKTKPEITARGHLQPDLLNSVQD